MWGCVCVCVHRLCMTAHTRHRALVQAAIVLPEEPVWLDTSEDPNAAKISVVPIFVTKSKNKLKLNR